ncbi:amidase family protein [Gulosibacter macacae]|nr:amidase family protein [Gulosibacter macacae]
MSLALSNPVPGNWDTVATDAGVAAQLARIPEGTEPFALAVKANIAVAGFPFSASNRALAARIADADAGVVSALRHRGTVVVGTTNMHELAFGITSNNAAYGPVRHPQEPARSAGGSSGGSAAAVALGEVEVALGTDTGGSVSIPASICGVYGYRPSVGRWPLDGKVGLSTTRDTAGVFARSLDRVIEVAGWLGNTAPESVARPVIGVTSVYTAALHPHTAAAWDAALERLRQVAEAVEVDFAEVHDLAHPAEMPVVLFEARRLLTAHAAEAFGCPPNEALARLRDEVTSEDVRAVVTVMVEHPVSSADYAAAMADVALARERYERMLRERRLDALVFPSTPAPAHLIEDDITVEHLGERVPTFPLYTRNTGPGTMLGTPMVTLPVPVDGLPVGITLMGARFGDARVLGVAAVADAALSRSVS